MVDLVEGFNSISSDFDTLKFLCARWMTLSKNHQFPM